MARTIFLLFTGLLFQINDQSEPVVDPIEAQAKETYCKAEMLIEQGSHLEGALMMKDLLSRHTI